MTIRARRGSTTVEITGVERLRGRLEDIPDDLLQVLQRVVLESAEAVVADTKRNVRVGKGDLRDNVTHRFRDGSRDLIVDIGWFNDEHYYAAFHELGTRRFPAQPALGPALEAERRRVRARMTDEIRRLFR